MHDCGVARSALHIDEVYPLLLLEVAHCPYRKLVADEFIEQIGLLRLKGGKDEIRSYGTGELFLDDTYTQA